jgi:hypothetical protein
MPIEWKAIGRLLTGAVMGVWKKLLAGVVGLGFTATTASAQAPVPGQVAPRVTRAALPDSDDFRGAIFAIPGSEGVEPALAQEQLAATTPNPAVPPQPIDIFDPNATPRPEDFVFGANRPRTSWQAWAGAEFLLGTGTSVNVLPVVTTGPVSAGLFNAGAIGQPTTTPLFGGRKMLGDWRGGLRAEGGLWLDLRHDTGITGRFYSLFSTSEQLNLVGDGTSVINVPQFLSVGGTTVQVPAYVGYPGLTTGTVASTAQSMFAGGDLNLRRVVRQSSAWRIDALLGYRQMYLRDELGTEFTAVGQVVPPPNTPFTSGADNLRTRNHFYGVNTGVLTTAVWRNWMIEALGAVALGVNQSDLDFDRNRLGTVGTAVNVPLIVVSVRDPMTYFSVVGEGGVRLAYRVNTHLKLHMGYTGLCWWNVRRAQEQPTFGQTLTGATTDYIAHMISFGAELRY